MTIAALHLGASGGAKAQSSDAVRLPIEGELPPAIATDWLYSKPLSAADLRGKVALIDFWTYFLHQLATLAPPFPRVDRDRQFTIEFLDSGVEVFSFTFG